MPSMATFAPWLRLASRSRKAWTLPDISRPNIEPFLHTKFFLHLLQCCIAGIDGLCDVGGCFR